MFCLDDVQNCTRSLLKLVSGWLLRHVIGAVLVSLPAVSVFSHLAYSLQLPIQVSRTSSPVLPPFAAAQRFGEMNALIQQGLIKVIKSHCKNIYYVTNFLEQQVSAQTIPQPQFVNMHICDWLTVECVLFFFFWLCR